MGPQLQKMPNSRDWAHNPESADVEGRAATALGWQPPSTLRGTEDDTLKRARYARAELDRNPPNTG